MSDWTQDKIGELPNGIEAKFDDAGRLTFLGNDAGDRGKSEFIEVDWSQGVARYTTRNVVVSDGDLSEFVDRFAGEIRRSAERRAAGTFAVCAFCQKGQNEVAKIIAGPQVYICDECIRLCNDILDEEAVSS